MSTQASPLSRQENSPLALRPSWPARYARFGPFQVDLQKDELYREGRRAKVQAKIYQALLTLLARPSDIITRDEVCRQLWPEALNVNLDANVNTTINKLRLVLGDSPETPQYVETIPRRGYTFIAAVQFSDEFLPVRPRVEVNGPGAPASKSAPQASAPWKNWLRSLKDMQPTPLRLASFVLVGMLLGALLVLVWKFGSSKNEGTQNFGRQSVSVPVQAKHNL